MNCKNIQQIIFMFGFVILPSLCLADFTEFRGHKLGSPPTDTMIMVEDKHPEFEGTTLYREKDELMSIGNMAIKNLGYIYFENRLYVIAINFKDGDGIIKDGKILSQQEYLDSKPTCDDWSTLASSLNDKYKFIKKPADDVLMRICIVDYSNIVNGVRFEWKNYIGELKNYKSFIIEDVGTATKLLKANEEKEKVLINDQKKKNISDM